MAVGKERKGKESTTRASANREKLMSCFRERRETSSVLDDDDDDEEEEEGEEEKQEEEKGESEWTTAVEIT